MLSQALSLSVLGQRADRQAGITAAGQETLSLFRPSCSQIWPGIEFTSGVRNHASRAPLLKGQGGIIFFS